MPEQSTPRTSLLRALLLGSLFGALFLCPDGALIGLFVGEGDMEVVGHWAAYSALTGAILGGLIAVLMRYLGPRMVLQPPAGGKEEEGE